MSDIDERIMEMRSQILLNLAYAKNRVGHGLYNFDNLYVEKMYI
jgi:hypothetical protein